MNTVTASFNMTVRQITEMSQQTKKKLDTLENKNVKFANNARLIKSYIRLCT